MENNDELYHNLVTLLKLFKNRPYHLCKYLIDNSALDKSFIEQLINSDKIKEIQEELESGENLPTVQFHNIGEMKEYFNSLTFISDEDPKELTKELNKKMDELVKSEKFEDAARLRDYMIRKNIRRKNNW